MHYQEVILKKVQEEVKYIDFDSDDMHQRGGGLYALNIHSRTSVQYPLICSSTVNPRTI